MAKITVSELQKTVAALEARIASLEAQVAKTMVVRPTAAFAPSERQVTKLRLILDVEFETNGEPIESLSAMLEDIPRRAASEGLLTASTCAEVSSWTCKVVDATEPVRVTIEVECGEIVDCSASQPVDVVIIDQDFDEPVITVHAAGRTEATFRHGGFVPDAG